MQKAYKSPAKLVIFPDIPPANLLLITLLYLFYTLFLSWSFLFLISSLSLPYLFHTSSLSLPFLFLISSIPFSYHFHPFFPFCLSPVIIGLSVWY